MADAIIEVLAGLGAAVSLEDFIPLVGTGERRCVEALSELRGVVCDVEETTARAYAVYAEMARGRLEVAPGVRDFVARARARGLRLAVASSAERVKVGINLSETGLSADTFDAIITGLDVPRRKPYPDVFLAAASRLDAPPAACLVVEDAVNGIEAARCAGMRCLAVASTFPPDRLTAADWVVSSLADAPEECLGW